MTLLYLLRQANTYLPLTGIRAKIKKFSVVIPLLFCHHEGECKYKLLQYYLSHTLAALHRFLPVFDSVVSDVRQLSDENIYKVRNVALTAMLMSQKYHYDIEALFMQMQRIYELLQIQEEQNSFNHNFAYLPQVIKNDFNNVKILEKK